MTRVRLGTWRCPSRNSCEVFLEPPVDGFRAITFEWDAPPPLAPADEVYYLGVMLPAVTRRAQEYLEAPGAAVMIRP